MANSENLYDRMTQAAVEVAEDPNKVGLLQKVVEEKAQEAMNAIRDRIEKDSSKN